MKNQIYRILIFFLIILSLGISAYKRGLVTGTKADIVGNLKFTYPGGATPETLFNELDFKPGDCKEALVSVENLSAGNSIVGVFSDGETDSDGLSSALTIEINDGINTLYGPLPLSQFFSDSDILNQINLLTLPGISTAGLNFKVCFPNTDDNELQGDSVVFDLKFGQIPPPIELPEVCKALEGIVTSQIDGTPGNDNINGTSASEFIRGFEGNDKILGGGGSDCLIGDGGNDKLEGGTGNDIILGGEGNDSIKGGSDKDVIYGEGGNDNIDSGSADDIVYGGEGNDQIEAGEGKDYVEGGAGNDTVRGGSGEDTVFGQSGNDDIRGGSDNDTLDGGPDTDILRGDSGTDTCTNAETTFTCELP